MARKVFISVLGTSNYGECRYIVPNVFNSKPVRFIQEATLEYLQKQMEWGKDDVAYILLTKDAYQHNWIDNGQSDRNGNTLEQEGLRTRLNAMHLPFAVHEEKGLPIGNNETEIWEIFSRVYSLLEEGDELYFDLTHGFRYLPMLILTLGNYARYLKNVSIKSITYGNYEGRNRETNEALIVNLLPLAVVQDWAFAAGEYVLNGDVRALCSLGRKELLPILRTEGDTDKGVALLRKWVDMLEKVVLERQTCRSTDIIQSRNLNKLFQAADKAKSDVIPPLAPLFEYVQDSMKPFDRAENIKNALSAAVWCCDNGLYQQAITLLQEYIVSVVCVKQGMDKLDRAKRELVNKAFEIAQNSIPVENWNADAEEVDEIYALLKTPWIQDRECVNFFSQLKDLRNDINHAGMRVGAREVLKLRKTIENLVHGCQKAFAYPYRPRCRWIQDLVRVCQKAFAYPQSK